MFLFFAAHSHYWHQWLSHYGYAGLFALLVAGIVGVPVPDETLLTLVGYLAEKGELQIVAIWVTAFLGSACGITISYLLGRTVGTFLVRNYGGYVGMTPARIERVHQWFEHLGRWTLLIGYFVPGVRHLTAVVAGMTKLEWPVFGFFAYTGAALWVSTFIAVGYFVGKRWHEAIRQLHEHRLTVILVVAAGLVVYFLSRMLWRDRQARSSAVGNGKN